MNDAPDGPNQSKAGKKANLPLILALAGVLISMLSESIKEETTSYAVFALGIACTICALLFVIFRRKKAPSS
jgi:hypothetical protein